jgi:hypothetical protein
MISNAERLARHRPPAGLGHAERRGSYGATARAAIVLVGYLFLFQSPNVGTGTKIAFVAIAAFLAVLSAQATSRRMFTLLPGVVWSVRSLRNAAWLMVAFILVQPLSLFAGGVSVTDWTRDALNYAMLPVMLAIGIDWGTAASRRVVTTTTIVVGILGGVSYSVTWLGRRGSEGLAVEQFGLASSFIVFGGVCLCLAIFVSSQKAKPLYLVFALVQLGLVALSGGRTVLGYSVGVIVIAMIISPVSVPKKIARAAVAGTAVVVAYTLMINVSTAFGGGVAAGRVSWFSRLADEGVGAILNDGSGIERARAYSWLSGIWELHPLLGQGLGHSFPSVTTGLPNPGSFTLDSPVVALAKFGILGTLVLVVVLILIARGVRGSRRLETHDAQTVRIFGILTVCLTLLLLFNGFPLENRGFVVFVLLASASSLSISSAPLAEPREVSPGVGTQRVTTRAPYSRGSAVVRPL